MLLGSKREGIDVDAGIRCAGVALVRLDDVEVRPFALREAVLAVELELGSHARVLTPAVHVECGLSHDECAGIGHVGTGGCGIGVREGLVVGTRCPVRRIGRCGCHGHITSTGHLEEARCGDEAVGTGCLLGPTESVDGVGESINGISVVEGLGTECLEEGIAGLEGRAIVDVGIGLDNPDKLLHGVVEVELDLVGGGTDRLITGELDLLEQILVGVLCHLSALVRVQEHVVNVEGRRNKGLLVGEGHRLGAGGGRQGFDGPQALTNGANIKIDFHLVVLESNQGECKPGVAAKPEKQGHVESGLRECVAGCANLCGPTSSRAGARHVGERGVRDVGKRGCVTNHLEVSSLLLGCHGHLVPDVHPVTILAVYSLTTNLDLNLGNHLLADVVQPTGIDTISASSTHGLVDFRECHLKVCAVAQVTVAADCACHTAAEIGLTREGLLNALHSKVCVSSVRHLPKSNLRSSSKKHVLCAVGD